jgi:flavorubredoxin
MNSPKILILYYSQTGNTEKIAQAVMKGIKSKINTVELKYFVSPDELAKADVIIIGAPTYNGKVPMGIQKTLEETKNSGVDLKGKIGAAFGSYGWSGEAPSLILKELENTFQMRVYKPALLVKGEPTQKDLDNSIQFGLEIVNMAS